MPESFTVKSRMHDYRVWFANDLKVALGSRKPDEAFLVSDRHVWDIAKDRFGSLVIPENVYLMEASEENKTLKKCEDILSWLVKHRIRKNHILVALGGGVVQDVTAFVSTILYRGITWAFVPTTLLAQADSCIGSKSSINFSSAKNLLGAFYPPNAIVIDAGFLKTLPEDQVKSGIGEILHFYLIDGQLDLAKELMGGYEMHLKDPQGLGRFVRESLKIKKAMVEIDELDKNERNIFNYGHTFGHAIESVTSYGVNHGQAVSLGMDIANHLSVALGYLNEGGRTEMHAILEKNLPDFQLTQDNMEQYMVALSKDKKNVGNNLGCILTRRAGDMFKVQIPFDKRLKDLILSYFGSYQLMTQKNG